MVENVYKVNSIPKGLLKIKGSENDSIWSKATNLEEFSSPWNTNKVAKVSFKALWDSENFFFRFTVFDTKIYTHNADDTLESINNSDRVELFFRSDKNMNPYYCLEIDTTARIMDFKALPNKIFNFNWNWPSEDIHVKASIENTHFIVEGAISLKSLENLGLLKNNKIETGIYRAKYNAKENGNYEPTWITWINPETKNPNFHTSSSFGVLKLV